MCMHKAFLIKLPDSGSTTALMHDKPKADVIKARMRSKLTHMRNSIKDVVSPPFPSGHIVTNCTTGS